MKSTMYCLLSLALISCDTPEPTGPVADDLGLAFSDTYDWIDSETDSIPPDGFMDSGYYTLTSTNAGLGYGYSGWSSTFANNVTEAQVDLIGRLFYQNIERVTRSAHGNRVAQGIGYREAQASFSVNDAPDKQCGHHTYTEGTHNAKTVWRYRKWTYTAGYPPQVSVTTETREQPLQQRLSHPSAHPHQEDCPPPPPPSSGGGSGECGDTGFVGNCTCEWVEYGVFVLIRGEWVFHDGYDTWYEYDCVSGNGIAGSPNGRGRQSPELLQGISVQFVLVPDAAFGAPAGRSMMLRRSRGGAGEAIIMIRESALSPREIATAYAGYLAWTKKEPDHSRAGARGPVQVSISRPVPIHPWAYQLSSSLNHAPERNVAGVGRFRAVPVE